MAQDNSNHKLNTWQHGGPGGGGGATHHPDNCTAHEYYTLACKCTLGKFVTWDMNATQ